MQDLKSEWASNPPTCRKPLKGANPVPGPIIMIGTLASVGSLKFDCLTKMGAQLQSLLFSIGKEFCKKQTREMVNTKQFQISDAMWTCPKARLKPLKIRLHKGSCSSSCMQTHIDINILFSMNGGYPGKLETTFIHWHLVLQCSSLEDKNENNIKYLHPSGAHSFVNTSCWCFLINQSTGNMNSTWCNPAEHNFKNTNFI